MGLFLWDNKSWMFVENNFEYVTKNFVIARKLFIKWYISNGVKLKEEINREFRLFGPIQSIEIIKVFDTIAEAYILYQNSQSAFNAFSANRNELITFPQLQHMVPADTWQQPDSMSMWMTIDITKCSIMNLNDDCLLEMFKYLDLDAKVNMSKVCVRFEHLLDQFYFPNEKVYTVYIPHASLNMVRQTMKCIGPHLVQLCLRYQNHTQKPKNYIGADHEERTTYKVLQNIRKKLRKLTIERPPDRKISKTLMELFVPAFQQITHLKWDTDFDCDAIEQLRELCPCLETLVLRKRTFNCNNHHIKTDLHWSSLRTVDIYQYMSQLSEQCQQFLEQFIQSNPQLKRLNLTNVNNQLFKIVTQFSKDLEHLEMLQNFDLCNIHSELTLPLLRNLENLKVFVIRVKMTKFLNDVENQIKCLSQIKQLELIVLLRNYSPIWPREYFPFAHYHADIMVDGNEMKLKIGENVESFEFSKGNTTLVNIINSNNPRESCYLTLQRDIRLIFATTNLYFPENRQSITFENYDCHQYIHVSSIS